MILANCLEIFASSAAIDSLKVTVRFLFQLTVPFNASSVNVLISSCERDISVCLVAPMTWSSMDTCTSVDSSSCAAAISDIMLSPQGLVHSLTALNRHCCLILFREYLQVLQSDLLWSSSLLTCYVFPLIYAMVQLG